MEQFEKTQVIRKKQVTTNKQGNTRWTARVLSKLDYLERPLQAQKKLERPLKPQAVNQALSLNKLTSECKNLERPLQPKTNSSRPLQPK